MENLERLATTDWTGANESEIREELIFPVLRALGYGRSTLNPIKREVSVALTDPYLHEGHSRIRIDYLPTVLGRELWVIEAKGALDKNPKHTLHQARSYAIHPEIGVALMVVFDGQAIKIHDPWTATWTTPVLEVPITRLAEDFQKLRDLLGPEEIGRTIRRRQLQHMERALGAGLDLNDIDALRREVDDMAARAREQIQENRNQLQQHVREEADRGWKDALRTTGVWAVAQHCNTVFVGVGGDAIDLAVAVTHRPVPERVFEMGRADDALAAVTRQRVPDAAPAVRPLWYWRHVKLASALQLRGAEGCEELATQWAREGLRDALLNFPDDPVAREAHRFQLAVAPFYASVTFMKDIARLDEWVTKINENRSIEQQIRSPVSERFFRRAIIDGSIRHVLEDTPWTVDAFARLADAAERVAGALPRPEAPEATMWDDPLFEDWKKVEPFRDCTLVSCMEGGAEDLIAADRELLAALKALAANQDGTRTSGRASAVLARVEATGGKRTPPQWWDAANNSEED